MKPKLESILLVEDDPNVRDIFAHLLTSRCDQLYIAQNGLEGLNLYFKESPCVIMTDIDMPLVNGLTMISAILAHNPNAKIISFSAETKYYHMVPDTVKFFEKPIDFSNFFDYLDEIFLVKRSTINKVYTH